MKKNILWSMAIALGLFATACVEDDNPDISEHPWNYKLTPVNVGKVPTGIIMYNPSGWWNNAQIMRRLEEEYNAPEGKYGPNVKVSAGAYELFGTNRDYHEEYAQNLGVIVENVKKAKIDYILLRTSQRTATRCIPITLAPMIPYSSICFRDIPIPSVGRTTAR